MRNETPARALVLGLGNPFMGDDGVGIAALEGLRARWTLPPTVETVDGGIWGMNLLPLIEAASQVLLLDAIITGAPAGSVVVLERDQLPRYLHRKLSPHQIDLCEILALAELREALPARIVALGVEPARVEWGEDLSPEAAAAIAALADAAAARLRTWGHAVARDGESVLSSLSESG